MNGNFSFMLGYLSAPYMLVFLFVHLWRHYFSDAKKDLKKEFYITFCIGSVLLLLNLITKL